MNAGNAANGNPQAFSRRRTLVDMAAEEVFGEAVPRRDMRLARVPEHIVFVAPDHGQVVAQAQRWSRPGPSVRHVDGVSVAPAFCQLGLATKLMNALFVVECQAGCDGAARHRARQPGHPQGFASYGQHRRTGATHRQAHQRSAAPRRTRSTCRNDAGCPSRA